MFADLKPLAGFMAWSIKRLPGTPRDLIVNCLLEMIIYNLLCMVAVVSGLNNLFVAVLKSCIICGQLHHVHSKNKFLIYNQFTI